MRENRNLCANRPSPGNLPTCRSAYRSRIYQYYVKASTQSIAPESIGGLKPRSHQIKKIIRDHFPQDRSASILDLGCGHGAFIHFIRAAGYIDVSGIDRSPQQVAAANRLGVKNVLEGDLAETLCSLPEQSKDVIITFDVLEHFTKDEMLGFVDEVYRVIHNGGKWIIHTPNGESPFGGRMLFWDYTHELAFTRNSISQLLLASGFSKVSCYEDVPVVHGTKSAIRFFLWKCIRALLRLYMAVETGSGKSDCIFTQNFLTIAIK